MQNCYTEGIRCTYARSPEESLETVVDLIDGIFWIATSEGEPHLLEIGVSTHNTYGYTDGLRRHPQRLKPKPLIIAKSTIKPLLSALFPPPHNRDLHSIHRYKTEHGQQICLERVGRSIYKLTLGNASTYASLTDCNNIAISLAVASLYQIRIGH